jgi:hypothetical protein
VCHVGKLGWIASPEALNTYWLNTGRKAVKEIALPIGYEENQYGGHFREVKWKRVP